MGELAHRLNCLKGDYDFESLSNFVSLLDKEKCTLENILFRIPEHSMEVPLEFRELSMELLGGNADCADGDDGDDVVFIVNK